MSSSKQPDVDPSRRTIGQALAGLDVNTAFALAWLVLVLVGSIGPWITAPLNSSSGMNGDGVITAVGTLITAAAIVRGSRIGAAAAALLICGVGIYDVIHIAHQVSKVTLFGRQIDHVGWGLYLVVVAGIGTLGALYRGREHGVSETVRAFVSKLGSHEI